MALLQRFSEKMCAITGGENATKIAADENESKRTRGRVNGFCKSCCEFAFTVAVSFEEGTKSPSSAQPLFIAKLSRIPLIGYVLQLCLVLLLTAAASLVKTLESVDTFQLAAARFALTFCFSMPLAIFVSKASLFGMGKTGLLFLRSICSSTFVMLFYFAVRKIPIATQIISYHIITVNSI
jgi:hypothetical protein